MTDACTAFLQAWATGDDITTRSRASPALVSAFTKLLTDPTIPAADAADEILNPRPREHGYDPEPAPPSDVVVLRMLIDAAEHLTEMTDRLVDFSEALEAHPSGEYKDLVGLEMFIDEFSWHHQYERRNRQLWYNLNAYCARLAAIGLPSPSHIHRGGRVLRKALETNWGRGQLTNLDLHVRAAKIWIRDCGSRMYQERGELETLPGSKWKGPQTWSRERWAFWKTRFEWVTSIKILKQRTRDEAQEAIERMDDIEERFA